MTPNIERLQIEKRELETLIQAVNRALQDSRGVLNAHSGEKVGFMLQTQAGRAAWLRCDESMGILTDALHDILTLKTRRLEAIKVKLAAIEELLEDSI